MTIIYHGTPITPTAQAVRMRGEHFCVSYYYPQQADICEQIGSSVLWDNGAFSAHTNEAEIDERALYDWLEPRLYHPHRAVVLDAINKPVEVQREMLNRWPFPRELSWPVWHLDKPLDYLSELADEWGSLCFGSAGAYWQIGSTAWVRKMDEAFEHLLRRGRLPWVHGLRMISQVECWPLASADSTNVAQNFARDTGCALCKARSLKGRSFTGRGRVRPTMHDLFEELL